MFAPIGIFLCRKCKIELYDANKTYVNNDHLVFREECDYGYNVICKGCHTILGFTKKDEHHIKFSCLIYVS